MSFAGKVWRLLVGIKDALALLFLLLFFTVLFAALSARPSPIAVRDGALLLELNGVVVEEAAPVDPITLLLSQSVPVREYEARDLVHAIDEAAKDERIKAIALDLTGFIGGGQVHMAEISDALGRFRAGDKPVLAFGMAYTDDALLLAANASEIWVDPMGGAIVRGPGGESLYYGDALERFGIEAHVFRVGTFKSATEPYTANAMSDEARENLAQIYATLWQEWQAKVKQARPKADLALVSQDVPAWLEASGGDLAKASRAAGLVDTIGTREEWGDRLAELAGKDPWSERPGAFAKTEFDPWLADIGPAGASSSAFGSSDPAIGVVTIAGVISDTEAGPGSAGAERITRLLDNALDDDLAALVVRVDSPGGTTTGSETIRRALMRHRDKGTPIVISMGNVAASGGYWIATAGERIFAEPETITGSIGVFLVLPTFEELLRDYGVSTDGVRTTGLSGQPDILGGLTPEAEALLQSQADATYGRFLGLVAKARGIDRARADELGQGRLWDGGAARQMGLVDQFGDLDAAIAFAGEKAGLAEGKWQVRRLGGEVDPFAQMLAGMMGGVSQAPASGGDVTAQFARAEKARIASLFAGMEALLASEGVQAHCLVCPAEPGAALRKPSPHANSAPFSLLGWLARLARD